MQIGLSIKTVKNSTSNCELRCWLVLINSIASNTGVAAWILWCCHGDVQTAVTHVLGDPSLLEVVNLMSILQPPDLETAHLRHISSRITEEWHFSASNNNLTLWMIINTCTFWKIIFRENRLSVILLNHEFFLKHIFWPKSKLLTGHQWLLKWLGILC